MHLRWRTVNADFDHMPRRWSGLVLYAFMTPAAAVNGIVSPHDADNICLVRQRKRGL